MWEFHSGRIFESIPVLGSDIFLKMTIAWSNSQCVVVRVTSKELHYLTISCFERSVDPSNDTIGFLDLVCDVFAVCHVHI